MLIAYYVHVEHVSVSFARSGGPGGQNVNKGLLHAASLKLFCINGETLDYL